MKVADPADVLLNANGRPAVPQVPAPTFDRAGDEFTVRWSEHRVEMVLSGIHESKGAVHAESRVTLAGQLVDWGQLNLASRQMREGLVKKLAAIEHTVPWRECLEFAVYRTVEEVRTGTPLVEVRPAPRPTGQRDLIERVMPLHETSLVYADGDSGKGMLALLMALATITGREFPHLRPTRIGVRVAWLDWETTEGEIAGRADGLCRGERIALPAGLLWYRPMSRALADEAPRLRAELARRDIGLVIVDSMVPACGSEPEGADATIRTLNALRSFSGTTRLVIAHVNRNDADKTRGRTRPWGSVFVRNLVRAAWEIKRVETDGPDLVVGAYLDKRNDGKRGIAPWGLRFEFADDGAVTVRDAPLRGSPELLAKATLWQQIRAALSNGPKMAEAIACELDQSESSVRKTLERYREKGEVLTVGASIPRPWGLKMERTR